MTSVRQLGEQTLRPRKRLFQRAVTAVIVVLVIVFASLYWLSIPLGTWPWVAIGQAAVMILLAIGILSTRGVSFLLTDGAVQERGAFGYTRTVRVGDADSIMLVDLYVGSGMETDPHLFVVDAHDRLLLRMHGQIWTRASMQQVAAHLGAPVVHAPQPMTFAEFTRLEPQLLLWWERRPIWR
jgi:hypothetical protein